MTEFEVIEVKETTYLYAEGECGMDPSQISAAMGEVFGTVYGFMQERGIVPAGQGLAVYYGYDPEVMRFRAGFTVSAEDMARAEGSVKGDVTPAGRVVHFTHLGTYATLRDDYTEMMGWMQMQGHQMSAPTWEIYMNDPSMTPAEELVTEVYSKIAEV